MSLKYLRQTTNKDTVEFEISVVESGFGPKEMYEIRISSSVINKRFLSTDAGICSLMGRTKTMYFSIPYSQAQVVKDLIKVFKVPEMLIALSIILNYKEDVEV
jgi:hypothetical protein